LRQAGSAGEATQWLHLLDALGSDVAAPLLPHMSLRAADAEALLDLCPRAAESLRRILAETGEPDPLAQVNGVLASLYADMESRLGARLARSVFALASDGFPDAASLRLLARWEQPLRLLLQDFAASGLPESKRDVVTAMVGHHVAEMDALPATVARRGGDADDAARFTWLRTLVRWRRFASLGRALARVLNAAERERLAAFTRAAGNGAAPGAHRTRRDP
jgi:hypothetical protein